MNNKLLKVFHEPSINFLTHKLMNIFKVQNTRELNEHASWINVISIENSHDLHFPNHIDLKLNFFLEQKIASCTWF